MSVVKKSANVFVLGEDPDFVYDAVIPELKQAAAESPLKRARLCLHRDKSEAVHEMLIVLAGDVYIRPHRHLNKTESFHLIEGRASVVFFDETGQVERNVRLSRDRGDAFLYRIGAPVYHTQLIWSDFVVFYECTRGPFLAEETEYASWAPEEGASKVGPYMAGLRETVQAVTGP